MVNVPVPICLTVLGNSASNWNVLPAATVSSDAFTVKLNLASTKVSTAFVTLLFNES